MAKVKIRLHDIGVDAKPDKKFTKSYDIADKNLLRDANDLRDQYGYNTYYLDPARKRKKA